MANRAIVTFLEQPTVPGDPSEAILGLPRDIKDAIENTEASDADKQVSLRLLAGETKEQQIELLVRGAMATLGFQPDLYEQCVYSTAKKAMATRLLDNRSLSEWSGCRHMTLMLQEMGERAKRTGKDYCLTAPAILCVYILIHFRKVANRNNLLFRMISEHRLMLKLPTAIANHAQICLRRAVAYFEISRPASASVHLTGTTAPVEAAGTAPVKSPETAPVGPAASASCTPRYALETSEQVQRAQQSRAGPAVTPPTVEAVTNSPEPLRRTMVGSPSASGARPEALDAKADGSPTDHKDVMPRAEPAEKYGAFLDTMMELCNMRRQFKDDDGDAVRMVKAHKANARLSQGIKARLGHNSTVGHDFEDLMRHLGPAFEASAEETGDLAGFFQRAKNCDVPSSTTKCLAQLVVGVRRLRREPRDELLDFIETRLKTLTEAIGSAEYSSRFERHVQVNNRDLSRQIDDEMAATSSPPLPPVVGKRSREIRDDGLRENGGKRHLN